MKLLSHEKYLLLSALVFTLLTFVFAFFTYKTPNTVAPKGSLATPYYIDINSATADELDTLEGIGPAIAGRIIDFREKNGDFESIEDLTKVSGIGSSTLDKIKDYIVIN